MFGPNSLFSETAVLSLFESAGQTVPMEQSLTTAVGGVRHNEERKPREADQLVFDRTVDLDYPNRTSDWQSTAIQRQLKANRESRTAPHPVQLDKFFLLARRNVGKRYHLTWRDHAGSFFQLSLTRSKQQADQWELRCHNFGKWHLLWTQESSADISSVYERIQQSSVYEARKVQLLQQLKQYAANVLKRSEPLSSL